MDALFLMSAFRLFFYGDTPIFGAMAGSPASAEEVGEILYYYCHCHYCYYYYRRRLTKTSTSICDDACWRNCHDSHPVDANPINLYCAVDLYLVANALLFVNADLCRLLCLLYVIDIVVVIIVLD